MKQDEIVQVDSAARSTALAAGRVGAIFWTKVNTVEGYSITISEAVEGSLTTEPFFAEHFARVFKK